LSATVRLASRGISGPEPGLLTNPESIVHFVDAERPFGAASFNAL